MAIREIKYTLSPSGISPAAEQFGGVQGDHRATKLSFELSADLKTELSKEGYSKVLYRFDTVNGEGSFESYGPLEYCTEESIEFHLEDWLTAYGGKISVNLVFTAFDANDKMVLENYEFPAKLRFISRSIMIDGEEKVRESLTTLSEYARVMADSSQDSANESKSSAAAAQDSAATAEGYCIESVEMDDNGNFVITYKNGNVLTLKCADQNYNAESKMPQSGIAVAQAVAPKMDKFGEVAETDELIEVDLEMPDADGSSKPTRFRLGYEAYIERSAYGNLTLHFGEKVIYIDVGAAASGVDFNGMALHNVEVVTDPQNNDVATVGYVNKICVPEREVWIFDGYRGLENNKEYIASNPVSSVEFGYSNDVDIICSLMFTTAAEGDINITFPEGTKFIGAAPTFGNNETWEFNIKNGVAVGGKVV